ncbi:MAG: histidine--tRNA ligase [Candidatus Magasanikbacteria bacterium]|nr:histidine--tRNA ligase [Candidatus Magasanikbacteria bacterium]
MAAPKKKPAPAKKTVARPVAKKEAPRKAGAPFVKKEMTVEKPSVAAVPNKKQIQLLRGMKDILPRDQYYWKAVYEKMQNIAEDFGFDRIDTPILEDASLFLRGLGKVTDIVEKEMYVFEDRDADKVTLRPEATASVVRAYLQHGMWNQPQPVKLWYWGPMFRHERPQEGRQRQFWQGGFEILGDSSPVIDAMVIQMTYLLYTEFGVPVTIHINSMGMPEDRTRYKMELVQYYRAHRNETCEQCKARLMKNPMRVLDCKEEGCQPIKANAPQIVDYLSNYSRDHFMKVLEYLDELGIPYFLNHTLVRGLDYYTKTVFEVVTSDEEQGSQTALCGGGRYDLLIEELGGKPTPACCVAPGIERLILQIKKRQLPLPPQRLPKVYVAQLGDLSRRKAMVLFARLRAEGIMADQDFSKGSLKAQLESANAKKIPFAFVIGQKEVQEGTVIMRDMDSGVQETVDFNKAPQILKRKLGLEKAE